MTAHRFVTLVSRDAAGYFTAVPVESFERGSAGHAATAAQALEQVRAHLTWQYERAPDLPGPDLTEAKLATLKVPVRPEYRSHDRIFAADWTLTLPVACVAGTLSSGLLVAALPWLDVRFYYHEPPALEGLVIRYAQQALKGLTPRELTAFLPPVEMRLEEVVVRVPRRARRPNIVAELPALTQVADPLGERAVRKQFGAAWERHDLVQAVVRQLHQERGSLLLVGEPGTGKTTVIVEAVHAVERLRAEAARVAGETLAAPRLFWSTSAARLIAGMKYLGQWEERCERIIDELARLPGFLCVDRLLDLVRLGGTSPLNSLAAFLQPYVQRGELRLVGEATPAELDACRRLLPGFADLFPIVALPAFTRPQAMRVLDLTAERLAQNLQLNVSAEATGRVYHLYRRFEPYRAFPGPAVRFLNDLCRQHARTRRGQPVSGGDVTDHYLRHTGLPRWLLRDEDLLDVEQLRADFRRQVLGQDQAVEAVTRVLTQFKAGLNDPGRPLGVLLFCGPTGVGKTELARTLARTLFGNADHQDQRGTRELLVHLDMSEYAGPDAVSRLLGPEGGEPSKLIRRLRQQPFGVLLLDEIEKAAPEVFDVLLGICDEGRLTDRFGRTTTFRSSVIIMTSNLGGEQREAFGLGRQSAPFHDAVRAFFRPEFFNRLDEVVTFAPLQAATIEAITRKELAEIECREGIRHARLKLRWSDRLVSWLARIGFDVRYGARPLQRVLEQQVIAPLASYLVANPALRDVELIIDRSAEAELHVEQP